MVGVSFGLHRAAGLTLPVPWNDEAWHAWEGHAFARDGSLLAPEINPERPLVFKGHGYSVFLGTIFKLFGFSLATARWSSWACSVAIFAFLLLIYGNLPRRYISYPLLALFFLGSSYVVAGNVVREDALTIALICLGFLLFQHGRSLSSVAIASLAVVVHPNAIYFFAVLAVGAAAILIKQRQAHLDYWDWSILLLCGAGVAASAVFMFRHWHLFLMDFFGPGLANQASRNPLGRLTQIPNIAAYIWFILLFVGSWRRDPRWRLPLLLGACCLIPPIVNGEMWYKIYHVTAYCTLIIASIQFSVAMVQRHLQPNRAWLLVPATIIVAIPFLLFARKQKFIEGPLGFPHDMEWNGGMCMQGNGIPFLTENDIEMVSRLVRTAINEDPRAIIEFGNLGCDSLFFQEALRGFEIRHRVYTSQGGDVIVFHVSRYHPLWVRNLLYDQMARYGVDISAPEYVRDETEKWYIQRMEENPNGTHK